MDFVFEVLVQIVVELLGELLMEIGFEGTRWLFERPLGRAVIGGLLGLGFGLVWGAHLSGGEHYPRPLWASLVLGSLAAVQTARWLQPRGHDDLLTLPWRWSAWRAGSFVLLNAALAGGILITFDPAMPLR